MIGSGPYNLIVRPRSQIDALEVAEYFADRAVDLDLAFRFLNAVEKTRERIAADPASRPISIHASPGDVTLRHWPVDGFANYLIFYRFDGTRVTVERVLHGARDMTGLFEP